MHAVNTQHTHTHIYIHQRAHTHTPAFLPNDSADGSAKHQATPGEERAADWLPHKTRVPAHLCDTGPHPHAHGQALRPAIAGGEEAGGVQRTKARACERVREEGAAAAVGK